MKIHAFAFLSNHYHLLVTAESSHQLASFVGYLNSKLAKEAGRLYGWRERFWGRRYQAIIISAEEEAQIARFRYVLSHGCKEGFVARLREWPGVHSAAALLSGCPLKGLWFNRTLEYAARRKCQSFAANDFATPETVSLEPLPCWQELSQLTVRERIRDLIEEIELEARQRNHTEGRKPLGAGLVRNQDPHRRPQHMKKSPAPLVHAATRSARLAFVDAYHQFVSAYRHASERLRAGLNTTFPEGSFPPPLPYAFCRAG